MDLREKRTIVMGLGRFGGGVAVARWLAQRGAVVTVTELADQIRLSDSLAQLAELTDRIHTVNHMLCDALEGGN